MTQKLKSLIMLLAIPMMCIAFSAGAAFAASDTFATQDGIVYAINGDGKTVTLENGRGYTNAAFNLPATINNDGIDYKVTAIDANAFENNQNITILIIQSDTLQTIGESAFKGIRLMYLTLDSANLRDVGKDAFADAASAVNIYLYTNSLKNNPFADGDEFPASIADNQGIFPIAYENVYVKDGGIILADGTRVALPARINSIALQSGAVYNMSSYEFGVYIMGVQTVIKLGFFAVYNDNNIKKIPDGLLPPDPPAPAPPRQGGSGMSDYERHGVSPREAVFEQGQSLSYEIDADFKRYIKLKYENDTLIRGVDYTVESGKIVLSPEWLSRLGRGEHALYAEFASGDAEINVIIEK